MNEDLPLYQRDPEAWRAHLAEGNAKQARKRVAADVLIRDAQDRVLLVDPSYKPDWDLPGGMAEANEPPAEAAFRELREELALTVPIGRLLCVDWVGPHGPWDDSLIFVFDGGTLTKRQAAELRCADDELNDVGFFDFDEAAHRLRPYVWQRAHAAIAALAGTGTTYMHDGKPT